MWLYGKGDTFGQLVLQLVVFFFGERGWHFDIIDGQSPPDAGPVVLSLLLQQLCDLWFFGELFEAEIVGVDCG